MINIKFLAAGLILFAVGCSSTDKKVEEPAKTVVAEQPKKEEPPIVAARSVDMSSVIDAQNEKLAKAPVAGLPPFDSGKKMDSYAKNSLETVKSAVSDLPEGYVLQITGHHNQHPEKAQRKGNGLSVQRAKSVYDYFVKNGISKDKLTYRGIGSAEYDKDLSRDNNRRVTFKIIKAGDTPAAKPKAEVKPDIPVEVKP